MSESVKKTISYYDYLKDTEEKYPEANSFAQIAIKDLGFPKESQSKDEIYDYLKGLGLPQYMLKHFPYSWDGYIRSGQAVREAVKQAWIDECEEYKKSEDYLIKHYCSEIRNEVLYYDQTFEEKEESNKRRDEHQKMKMDNAYEQFINKWIDEERLLTEKPNRMSDEEWVKKKRQIRAQRAQDNKDAKTDRTILMHTPFWITYQKVYAISCECGAEQLRQGIYCKTCKLLLKVDSYMMQLFKDAAEGRLSIK